MAGVVGGRVWGLWAEIVLIAYGAGKGVCVCFKKLYYILLYVRMYYVPRNGTICYAI